MFDNMFSGTFLDAVLDCNQSIVNWLQLVFETGLQVLTVNLIFYFY